MKKASIYLALLLGIVLTHGCKGDSPSGPSATPSSSGGVQAVCEGFGLNGQSRTLVGGDECNELFRYDDGENCDFVPVSQSFSRSCQGTKADCGADFSTNVSGSLDIVPTFDSTTGLLTAIRVSASVEAEFKGRLGDACGQIGNGANCTASTRIQIEVLDDPVTVTHTGSLTFDSSGDSTPLFELRSGEDFELVYPESGQDLSGAFELQPGTYTFSVSLRARPQFNAGPSSGSFQLSLQFQ